ncbi:MAG TPA: class I SAM-dependent methyltransferase [Pyrinomonadaceae bacterium]|jgi:ubiquinone/menaquinone biosynthesis C-methylase UbiE|nr:class I SAM-dependent methyltransferase [Pyrinomonadaceae bacterium]
MTVSEDQQKQLAVDTHSEQAGLFAERYSTIAEDPYQNCFKYSRYLLDQWLDKFIPERGDGLKMLDLGCGTGYHLAKYRERGFELTGVDGSEEMLEQARAINPQIEFHQGDVTDVPLPDDSFDYLVCIEVLRYLPDIGPCVSEIFRVLKPGGMALVTAAPPLQANLYPLVNKITASAQVGNLTHLKQFFHSSGKLNREFNGAGFNDVEVHGVYGGSMVWVERIVPSVVPPLLKIWEQIDKRTVDLPVLKHFSNMFLVKAIKP